MSENSYEEKKKRKTISRRNREDDLDGDKLGDTTHTSSQGGEPKDSGEFIYDTGTSSLKPI